MKLKDFDFRIWLNSSYIYLNEIGFETSNQNYFLRCCGDNEKTYEKYKIKDEEDEEFVAIAKKYTDDSIPLYFMLYEPNRKNWYDFEYYETEIIGNIHEVEIGKVYF